MMIPLDDEDCPGCGSSRLESSATVASRVSVSGVQPFNDTKASVAFCEECGYVWSVNKVPEELDHQRD